MREKAKIKQKIFTAMITVIR